MKKTIKLAFAAFAFVAFTACGDQNNTTANEGETTEPVETETEMEMDTEMNSDLESDTVTLQDEPADGIVEEQPIAE